MLQHTKLILTLLLLSAMCCAGAVAEQFTLVIDTIVASVNGKPITLRELCARLHPPRQLSLSEAAADPAVRQVLDDLILERLILEEAQVRRVGANQAEVDAYVEEVAKRNNLSVQGLEKALKDEGKNFVLYKEQLRIDILKSKLISQLMQAGVPVSQEEIDAYLKDHPELNKSGTKLRLSQIFISKSKHNPEQASKLMQEIQSKLVQGVRFSELARQISESSEAEHGGSLGVMAAEDLSPDIFEKVFSLPAGSNSQPIESAQGYHIFRVDERLSEEGSENSDKVLEEARKAVQSTKLETRMQTYFTVDLYKTHAVDKKI